MLINITAEFHTFVYESPIRPRVFVSLSSNLPFSLVYKHNNDFLTLKWFYSLFV